MIDISPEQLNTVKNILKEHMPEYEVWAFGSRVTWTAKDYSDLDLALVGDKKISISKLRQLEDAFQESDLPFRVDVLDWNMIDDEFKKLIKEKYEVINKPKVRFGNKMNNNRNTYKLKDIANIIMGQSPKGSTYNKYGNGIPLLNGPTNFGPVHPDPTIWTTCPTKVCRKGDLLFCVRGSTTGRMNWADREYCLGRGVAAFRGKSSPLDTFFIYYSLCYELPRLLSLISGSVFPNLSRCDFELFRIHWPYTSEREAIAKILLAFDKKIELNRSMNKTLEGIARAVFKSWFVDFDPVKAKMEGKKPAGLPHEIIDLFSDKMVESDLGLIPEGWEVKSLGDFIEIKHGYAFKGKYIQNEPTEDIVLTPGNFAIGGGFKSNKFRYYTSEYPEEYILKDSDLIITMTDLSKKGDTLGYPAIIPHTKDGKFLHNQRLGKVIIKCEDVINKIFLYYLLRTEEYRHEILATATGSTVRHTSPNRIKAFKFIFPNNNLLNIFKKLLSPLYQKIFEIYIDNQLLVENRDTLLPKLISGQIRIKEAVKIAGYVL